MYGVREFSVVYVNLNSDFDLDYTFNFYPAYKEFFL
jgi:hypothetical protein